MRGRPSRYTLQPPMRLTRPDVMRGPRFSSTAPVQTWMASPGGRRDDRQVSKERLLDLCDAARGASLCASVFMCEAQSYSTTRGNAAIRNFAAAYGTRINVSCGSALLMTRLNRIHGGQIALHHNAQASL